MEIKVGAAFVSSEPIIPTSSSEDIIADKLTVEDRDRWIAAYSNFQSAWEVAKQQMLDTQMFPERPVPTHEFPKMESFLKRQNRTMMDCFKELPSDELSAD